jgi:hypothetical protein
VSDLVATLVTHRPDTLGAQFWAERDGTPFRARLAHPADLDATGWHEPGLVVADVATVELVEVLLARRVGVTLLIGYGEPDEQACARLFAAGRCAGFTRMDAFDSRSSLLSILDAYRSGDRARLLERLGGH